MKKLLFVGLLALCSCQREKCWTCTTYIKMTDVDTIKGTTEIVLDNKAIFSKCELTRAEIKNEEKRNTNSHSDGSITGHVITDYTTECE